MQQAFMVIERATSKPVFEFFTSQITSIRLKDAEKYAIVRSDEFLRVFNKRVVEAGGVHPPEMVWVSAGK